MSNSIFYAKILLNLARTGWLLRGVPASIAETVAEHSFLSAYVCIEIGSGIQGVDIGKVVLYSLIHDLGEAFVGDITKPVGLRLGELKSRIEEDYVVKNIDNEMIKEFYKRYVSQSDFEAKLAKLCNYISTLLIGLDYEKLGYEVDEIVYNMYNEVEKLSKELNIREYVEKLLSKLITDVENITFKNG
jgi:putative hydrolase of HD superfamily